MPFSAPARPPGRRHILGCSTYEHAAQRPKLLGPIKTGRSGHKGVGEGLKLGRRQRGPPGEQKHLAMQGGDRRCSRSPAPVWPTWGALWSVRTSWLPHVTTYGRSCTGLGCRCPVNDHDGVTGTGTAKGFELCRSDGLLLRMWCLWVLPTHPMAPDGDLALLQGLQEPHSADEALFLRR